MKSEYALLYVLGNCLWMDDDDGYGNDGGSSKSEIARLVTIGEKVWAQAREDAP